MRAPKPLNEDERLAALRALDVLDSPPEAPFDRIVRLASHLLGTPIALVSLVDADRQWFKAAAGLDATQTPRDQAFCAHAILEPKVMVVEDARSDPRFADNPLVTDLPSIRFYAGAPLMLSDDIRIGTLCTIDTEPRTITDEQRQALADLASIVVDELHLRRQVTELAEARDELASRALALRDANESLEQFAHMASHDMRAPIKTMINMADIALRTAEGPVARPLAFLRNAATRLEALVAGYRRLSRLTLGELATPTLGDLVRRAEEISSRSVDCKIANDGGIPCDPELMTLAMSNLLDNAATHGCSGSVELARVDTGDSVTVTVTNDVANPLDVDDGVFQPFRRLTTEGSGTGLGLAIVSRVARLHDGRVRARCEDRVFCVEVSLPRAAREAA